MINKHASSNAKFNHKSCKKSSSWITQFKINTAQKITTEKKNWLRQKHDTSYYVRNLSLE